MSKVILGYVAVERKTNNVYYACRETLFIGTKHLKQNYPADRFDIREVVLGEKVK